MNEYVISAHEYVFPVHAIAFTDLVIDSFSLKSITMCHFDFNNYHKMFSYFTYRSLYINMFTFAVAPEKNTD